MHSFIEKNYSEISDLLDTDDDLICELLSSECLTLRQLISIESTSDLCERNKKLLDLLLRSNVRTLNLFADCLRVTQPHLVHLVIENTGIHARSF
jgi:hypothetical protein